MNRQKAMAHIGELSAELEKGYGVKFDSCYDLTADKDGSGNLRVRFSLDIAYEPLEAEVE